MSLPKLVAAIVLACSPLAVGMVGPSRTPATAPDPAEELPVGEPVVIPGAEQFALRSRSGREYRIFVAGPKVPVADAGSPVIYLTDGNANFPVLLAAARQRSGEGPRAVVVGIGYPGDDEASHRERRTHDLTPALTPEAVAAAASLPGGRYASLAGGNEQFLDFIEGELKPIIERKFRIDRGRQAIFGHSFGGLFVLHALFSRPHSFQSYLASSPSIYWNDGSILGEQRDFEGKYAGKQIGARLLLTVGELESKPGRGLPKDRESIERRIRAAGTAKDLADRMVASKALGLSVIFREFAGEDHGSVVLPSASFAVRFALDGTR